MGRRKVEKLEIHSCRQKSLLQASEIRVLQAIARKEIARVRNETIRDDLGIHARLDHIFRINDMRISRIGSKEKA